VKHHWGGQSWRQHRRGLAFSIREGKAAPEVSYFAFSFAFVGVSTKCIVIRGMQVSKFQDFIENPASMRDPASPTWCKPTAYTISPTETDRL